MNNLLQYFIFFLELIESFFYTKVSGIFDKTNKKIIRKPFYAFIPYHILINFIDTDKYEYFLVRKNKYFYNKDAICISPPVLKITLDKQLVVTEIFNNYQNTFPLWLVISNEELNDFETITIKKQSILSEEEITLNIKDIEDLTLSKIYNK